MEGNTGYSRFHVGMRNIKTALAVFVVLAVYIPLGRDTAMLAVTAAIICMQDSLEKTVQSGLNRLIGTTAGALIGMLLLYLKLALPVNLTLLLAPAGVILIILFCNIIKKEDASVISSIMVLMILLEQSAQDPFIYSVNRLLDTTFGIAVALVINRFVCNPSAADASDAE